MRTCPVWTLHLVIKIVNANAVYMSLSVFPWAIAHCVYTDVEINTCSCQTSCPRLWDCVYWHSLCGVNRTCWTSGSWRRCLCLNFVSSIPARPFPTAREKTTRIFMHVCVRVCVYMHIHMPACLSPCTCVCPYACVYYGIVQYFRRGE